MDFKCPRHQEQEALRLFKDSDIEKKFTAEEIYYCPRPDCDYIEWSPPWVTFREFEKTPEIIPPFMAEMFQKLASEVFVNAVRLKILSFKYGSHNVFHAS